MTTLLQGDRGPAVLELQTLLAMTGNDPGPLDGVFGPRTDHACAMWTASREGGGIPQIGGLHADDLAILRALPRRAVELPRILTPISAVDMRIALVAGYADAFATREVRALPIRVALAQLAVEHGREAWDGRLWAKLDDEGHLPRPWLTPFQAGAQTYVNVWNFNIGNRQVRREDLAGRGPLAPWFAMSPVEGSGTSAHRATSAHYAYPNAADGAVAYWRFLRDHCQGALAAFERGDPAAAAHELKHGGWGYSGDEEAYTRGMVDRFRGIE